MPPGTWVHFCPGTWATLGSSGTGFRVPREQRAGRPTATPSTGDIVETLRVELQRTAKMRAALGEIRSILRETLG